MKAVHSIILNTNPKLQYGRNVRATRTSKTRQYGACVVATATAATEAWLAQKLAQYEAEAARLQPLVEAAQAVVGLSLEDAQAAHEKLAQAWFKPLFANEDKIRQTLRPYTQLTEAQKQRAIEMTVAEGFTNPYTGPLSDFLGLHRQLEFNTVNAAHKREQNIKEGQQLVLSWHRDASLAQKTIGSHTHYLSTGYTLEVRTDIEVVIK